MIEQIKSDFIEIEKPNLDKTFNKTMTITGRYTQNLKSGNICELPDGSVADLSMIPSIASDLFLNNEVFGYEGESLGGMIKSSIDKCDLDIKGELQKGILFLGGNAKMKNFVPEIMKDVKQKMIQVSGELRNIQYD